MAKNNIRMKPLYHVKRTCPLCGTITKLRRITKSGPRIDACTPCRFHWYMDKNPKPGYVVYDFYNPRHVKLPIGVNQLTK